MPVCALAALLLTGCASTGGDRDVDTGTTAAAAPASETASTTVPRQIEAMELREGAPSTYLDILADGPLVWTSYRDAEGNLVIELPNSAPSAAVSSLREGEGVVASVEVEREDIGSRPLTRLTVRTRGEAEHTLTAEGERLRLALMPVAQDQTDQTAQRAQVAQTDEPPSAQEPEYEGSEETSYEPLPVEEAQLTEVDTRPGSSPATPPQPTRGPESAAPGPPVSGVPATVLADVSVLAKNGGAEIKVSGDGSFEYSTFQLSNPDRYVIDLEGVVNASSSSTVVVDGGGVERVRVAQFKPFPNPVSRVVFDLSAPGEVKIEPTADGLVVRFGSAAHRATPVPEQVAVSEPETTAEPMAEDQVAEVTSEPMASEPTTTEPAMSEGTSEPQATESIVAETTTIAEPVPSQPEPAVTEVAAVEEPMDTAEESSEETMVEGTMVDAVEVAEVEPAYEAPESTQAGYEEPGYEEPSYREPADEAPISDVAMFEAAEVEYEPTTETKEGVTSIGGGEAVGNAPTWSGDPISLSLQDANIKDVLRSFSTITGLNVVVHPGVRGTVTVELNDVPWDQALDLILRINNLDYVLEGNIMRIASSEALRKEAEERRALAAAQAQEIPLQTVIRSISYAEATEIAGLLAQSALSARGAVSVDTRTNKLIIKELPSNMNTVLAVIANLDTAEPQVVIEARIVETTKQFSRTLGIQWSFDGVSAPEFGNTTGLVFPHQGTVDGGVQLLTGGQNGFLNIAMGNVLNTFNLDLSLQAAETEGLVSILSSPKIATLNNERASIQSGLQIPIKTVSNNTVSVQFVNATLQLQVTPQVTAEGTVMMDIDIAKRAPQPALAVAGATNVPISTKQARTRVIVRDGGTTVIGGIYEVTNDRGVDRVPGLANVPILGHLFRNKRRNQNNEELLIFLTPRVIQL